MSYIIQILFILIALVILKLVLISVFFYQDIRAAQGKDPAAKSFIEVLLLYQGLHALVSYRVANFL